MTNRSLSTIKISRYMVLCIDVASTDIRYITFFVDINECVTGDADCDENGFCENTDGSFLCSCNPGYTGLGTNGTCEGEL